MWIELGGKLVNAGNVDRIDKYESDVFYLIIWWAHGRKESRLSFGTSIELQQAYDKLKTILNVKEV